jgi:hypothetical protein
VGIAEEHAKTCLITIVYGAGPSGRDEDSIPGLIGVDATRRLFKDPEFGPIYEDVRRAGKAILKKQRVSRGTIRNAMNLTSRTTESEATQLAHLLQGVEARALEVVQAAHSADIVVLLHDGWVSRKQLNREELERTIAAATGYDLKLEEKQIKATDDPGTKPPRVWHTRGYALTPEDW